MGNKKSRPSRVQPRSDSCPRPNSTCCKKPHRAKRSLHPNSYIEPLYSPSEPVSSNRSTHHRENTSLHPSRTSTLRSRHSSHTKSLNIPIEKHNQILIAENAVLHHAKKRSSVEDISRALANFRNETLQQLNASGLKETKLDVENAKLRHELKMLAVHNQRLVAERDVAVEEMMGLLQRSDNLEADRNRIRHQFNLYRETKSQEFKRLSEAYIQQTAAVNSLTASHGTLPSTSKRSPGRMSPAKLTTASTPNLYTNLFKNLNTLPFLLEHFAVIAFNLNPEHYLELSQDYLLFEKLAKFYVQDRFIRGRSGFDQVPKVNIVAHAEIYEYREERQNGGGGFARNWSVGSGKSTLGSIGMENFLSAGQVDEYSTVYVSCLNKNRCAILKHLMFKLSRKYWLTNDESVLENAFYKHLQNRQSPLYLIIDGFGRIATDEKSQNGFSYSHSFNFLHKTQLSTFMQVYVFYLEKVETRDVVERMDDATNSLVRILTGCQPLCLHTSLAENGAAAILADDARVGCFYCFRYLKLFDSDNTFSGLNVVDDIEESVSASLLVRLFSSINSSSSESSSKRQSLYILSLISKGKIHLAKSILRKTLEKLDVGELDTEATDTDALYALNSLCNFTVNELNSCKNDLGEICNTALRTRLNSLYNL